MPHGRGLALGVLEQLLGGAPRFPDELVLLDHPLGAHSRGLEEPMGFVLRPLDDLVALLQQPARLAQLLRERVDRVLQHRAELFAVQRHRRRHRQLARVLQHLLETLQQRAGVGHLLGLVLEHRQAPSARNRSMRRSCTCFGTIPDTSPPKRATSRTKLDERKEYCGLVDRKNVSIPASFWFICAIWSS